MGILINENTTFIIQGITGREAVKATLEMAEAARRAVEKIGK